MTTIIVINAASSLLVTVIICGILAREKRRTRKAVAEPLYLTTGTTRPHLHR